MDIIRLGLKPYLAKAIAGEATATFKEFLRMVITTDKALQRLIEGKSLKETTTSCHYSVWCI
jgi:hypothetical protein